MCVDRAKDIAQEEKRLKEMKEGEIVDAVIIDDRTSRPADEKKSKGGGAPGLVMER